MIGHGHSGKTTLAAGLLYTTGATSRLTRVDEGATLTDFDDEEIARKITISTAVAAAEWNRKKINLLDTPGFNIFINDTKASLAAADAAFVLVDGVAGVEVQTEKVWSFCEEFQLPRAIVINKLDRERSSFERALESVQSFFGRTAIPVHLPIGSEKDFKGVVDLVQMKSYTYTPDGDGKGKEGDIPADLAEAAKAAHEALVEMVAEGNDAYLEEFFDTGTLPVEHIHDGLREAVRQRRMFPVLCASALHNVGSRPGSELRVRVLPRPRRTRTLERHAQRRREGARRQGFRAALAVRVQNHRRSVRRPRLLFQGGVRHSAERRQPGSTPATAARSACRISARCWARPSTRSPSCMRAISAAWRN